MVISSSELGQLRRDHREHKIGLRFGCYDILHAGHQQGIDYARTHADLLVIGVMPDEYVKRHKGEGRPINNEQQRVVAIDQAEGVDFSFIAEAGPLAVTGLFLRLKPDAYIEHIEFGASKLKAVFLASIGTKYVIHTEAHLGSSSAMITDLGISEALANSNLSYLSGSTNEMMPDLAI